MHQPPIRYRVEPHRPEAHLFRVRCTVADPDPAGQVFTLPAWIPGSYMIREFARNIVSLCAADEGGAALAVEKRDKHSWRVASPAGGGAIVVDYEVYAWDLSVRAAHLDRTHGFFNGTSVFLAAEGRRERECLVDIVAPRGVEGEPWRVITALPRAEGVAGAAPMHGFGLYRAADYDELIDHPVEMGSFSLAAFEAGGVRHEIALTGRHDCDTARLCDDLARICAWQIALFGAPAPVDYYAFLTMVVGDGYGGLEHRASTALLASRADLPWKGMVGMPDGYKNFLGLCSHEYFHTWNVKRIKPAAFVPYDLAVENYTRLLWAFEGFTSYYDDLALVRSGVIDADDYLGLLGKTVSNVLRSPGRFRQSVAESSFDAWTKFYRQDENAPNAIVSYYAKGALIALALDLRLRAGSRGEKSLDDVMRLLWQRHGASGEGVAEDGIFAVVAEVGGPRLGRRLSDWLREAVEGTDDLPLAELLARFGVEWKAEAASKGPVIGAKLAESGGEVRLASVFDGGPAERAGLSAGDVLVAADGLRIGTIAGLEAMLARRAARAPLELHAFRRDELMTFELELAAAPAERITLRLAPRAGAGARTLRDGWLGS
ncbi:MAG: M61 family metallopeptidase [Thauera phenolivorans]|uniref:M61 family metallopeptidase n=1 Tax=Thauera phenolivorans TaxID=1792543 RepID=A0A7X7R6B1_9RHOO|nr:PDZ domain-containing protein [Thauera phenolivorans]NLF52870.1 M61 family metallopeptidase [Thauera phenolivorans]